MRRNGILSAMAMVGFLLSFGGQAPAQLAPTAARLQVGEKLNHLFFTVRANYIVPEAVTVEEGWYQIHIYNPNGVASKKAVSIGDDVGKVLALAETKDSGPKSTLFYRFTPGKTTLKIDSKQIWSIAITVQAKKP